MGHNVDLVRMLGVKDEIICAKCNNKIQVDFDDYDIDCGEPNEINGIWELSYYCALCNYKGTYSFSLKIEDIKNE